MDLSEYRSRIDAIDAQMMSLFKERMAISEEIAQRKMAEGKPALVPQREREVLLHAAEAAGPQLANEARMLFSTIVSLSRGVQERLMAAGRKNSLAEAIRKALENSPEMLPDMPTVACCGLEGSFAFQAADKALSNPRISGMKNFDAVALAVDKGLCQYGILPIENSSFGTVKEVYDLLGKYHFSIVKALRLHVRHCLLAKPGTRLEDVKEIVTHAQAAGQCRDYLRTEMKGVHVTTGLNTAVAAKMVGEGDRRDLAAIASRDCAALYGLEVLKEDIQDHDNNYTRFICITRDLCICPGANRISLMLRLPHRVGSLSQLISRFAALGLNLTKLESVPLPGSDFEFSFYFDFEASVRTAGVIDLLAELSATTEHFVFLGNYTEAAP